MSSLMFVSACCAMFRLSENLNLAFRGCLQTPVDAFLAMSHSYIGKMHPDDLESDYRVRPAMAVPVADPSGDSVEHSSSRKRSKSTLKRHRDYVFPPALVVTAWFDALCDDGVEFAKKLASLDPNFSLETECGLNDRVTCVCYGQSFHGFFSSWTEGKEAMWQVCTSLRHHFGLDTTIRPE
jgi:acetyl esterase/lipase